MRTDLFDGIVRVKAAAHAIDEGDWPTLYRSTPPCERPATLTAVPYHLWSNRGQGSMLVWAREAKG